MHYDSLIKYFSIQHYILPADTNFCRSMLELNLNSLLKMKYKEQFKFI